jgi:hypothetical protein
MTIDEAVEQTCHEYCIFADIPGSVLSDWIITDRGTTTTGYQFWKIENTVLSRTFYYYWDHDCGPIDVTVILDEGCYNILEADEWIYGIYDDGTSLYPNISSMHISFEPKNRWQRGRGWDNHQQELLKVFYDLPDDIGEEMENLFGFELSSYNHITIHMQLKSLGFTYSQEMSDSIMRVPFTPEPISTVYSSSPKPPCIP